MYQNHSNIFSTVNKPLKPYGEGGICLVTVLDRGYDMYPNRYYTGIIDVQFLESGNTIEEYFEWLEEENVVFLFNCEAPLWFMKAKQIQEITCLRDIRQEYKKEAGLEKLNYDLNQFITRCLAMGRDSRHHDYVALYREYLKELNPVSL
jgi:hypothetical protein